MLALRRVTIAGVRWPVICTQERPLIGSNDVLKDFGTSKILGLDTFV